MKKNKQKENTNSQPHRRYNPLVGEWVLVSPQRSQRPWKGQTETSMEQTPEYDQQCQLCPGNLRASTVRNDRYDETYVFTNDFPALLEETESNIQEEESLFLSAPAQGTCRVICFSPKHNLTLAEMSEKEIEKVVNLWLTQAKELGQKYKWVQIFENKGQAMGCSNPHPHGQIWASDYVPSEVIKEDQSQQEYFQKNGLPLLFDYAQKELEKRERIIEENDNWVVVTPYWAKWPYETLLLPKSRVRRLTDLNSEKIKDLANILKKLLVKYDNLFQTSFPYSMGWHFAPFNNLENEHWQLHAHFYPPLLRSVSVKKFMVGYEMFGESQRDLTPEQATHNLNNQSNSSHYKTKKTIKRSSFLSII